MITLQHRNSPIHRCGCPDAYDAVSEKATVHIYDLSAAQETVRFEPELEQTVVRFTRDSKWLIIAGEDTKQRVAQVRRYAYRPDDLIREAQSRTVRDLTDIDLTHLAR